ncbi:MAG: hypothetical protein MH204_08875 [Fimbriimonadaceae bacterium]|nr:hypothetical protein [Fimbriimonadaceae bacterium]
MIRYATIGRIAAGLALAGAGGAVLAQDLPVSGSLETSTRFFKGAESPVYFSGVYRAEISDFGLRVAFLTAPVTSSRIAGGTLRTGGKDFELALERRFDLGLPLLSGGILISAGAAFSEMQNFRGTAVTYRAVASLPSGLGEVGVYGLTGEDLGIALLGASGGFSQGGTSYKVFLGTPISGDNTRSTNTGRPTQRVVWAITTGPAVGLDSRGVTFQAFVGNQLGLTTGAMLTPALGDAVGFGFSFGVRF